MLLPECVKVSLYIITVITNCNTNEKTYRNLIPMAIGNTYYSYGMYKDH